MARNPWKKYIIGIAGVTVIGSAVGLAQQLDSNNTVATTVTPTPSPVSSNDIAIEQQFAATEIVTDTAQPTRNATVAPTPTTEPIPAKEAYAWDDEEEHEEEYEHRHHNHDDEDDDNDDDDYEDYNDQIRSAGKMRSQAS